MSYVEGSVSANEWEESFDITKRLDEDAARLFLPSAAVMILGPEAERPNANRRKTLAELRSQKKAPKRLGVVVSHSTLVRGFLTTLDWIIPKPTEEENFVAPSFAFAVEWLEQKRGGSLPVLWELFREIAAVAPGARSFG